MEDMTNTFATVEDVKKETGISNATSPELIAPFINTAEIFWLKDTLGQTLWTELKAAISGDTLSGDNYTLVYNYIIPASVWYSYYEASVFIMFRGEAKGFTKKYSDNSQALEKKEFEMLRQSILDNAQTWRNRMIDYLEDNSTLYPSWRSNNQCGGSTKRYSGGIFL